MHLSSGTDRASRTNAQSLMEALCRSDGSLSNAGKQMVCTCPHIKQNLSHVLGGGRREAKNNAMAVRRHVQLLMCSGGVGYTLRR